MLRMLVEKVEKLDSAVADHHQHVKYHQSLEQARRQAQHEVQLGGKIVPYERAKEHQNGASSNGGANGSANGSDAGNDASRALPKPPRPARDHRRIGSPRGANADAGGPVRRPSRAAAGLGGHGIPAGTDASLAI